MQLIYLELQDILRNCYYIVLVILISHDKEIVPDMFKLIIFDRMSFPIIRWTLMECME